MKKYQITLIKYLLELVIVAFGVFLGMFISDWKKQQETDKNISKSLVTIIRELENNKAQLDKHIVYHQLIKQSFDSLVRSLTQDDMLQPYLNNSKFRHNQIPNWNGLQISRFDYFAFENAKNSGVISSMDMDCSHAISRIYAMQQMNEELGKSVFDRIVAMQADSKTLDIISSIELLTSDILQNEMILTNELDKAIQKIKSYQ